MKDFWCLLGRPRPYGPMKLFDDHDRQHGHPIATGIAYQMGGSSKDRALAFVALRSLPVFLRQRRRVSR